MEREQARSFAEEEIRSFVEEEWGQRPRSLTQLNGLSSFVCLAELEQQSVVARKFRPPSPFTRYAALHAPQEGVLCRRGSLQLERFIPHRPIVAAAEMDRAVCLLLMRPLAAFNAPLPAGDGLFHAQRMLRAEGPALLAAIADNLASLPDAGLRAQLDRALQDVLGMLERVAPAGGELVLAHNDFWHGNAIYDTDRERYTLIDFEYCAPNPPGYDIANYLLDPFIEYGAPEPPFFRLSEHYQLPEGLAREMIRCYLLFRREEWPGEDAGLLQRVTASAGYHAVPDAEVEAVFARLPTFFTVINCCWFLWALYYFASASSDFSYTAFALLKHQLAQRFYPHADKRK